MNYQTADALLTGRCLMSRKISYSCRLERRDDERIAVRMHQTDIITFHPDGRAVVDIGRWFTVTTKARLNDYLPFGRVWSEKGNWYLHHNERTWAFANGMTLWQDGRVEGAADETQIRKQQKLRKASIEYARAFVDAIERGEVAAPSDGDCWYCVMRTDEGKTLGEAFTDSAHIYSHMEEQYFVPSLAFRACETFGLGNWYTSALAGAVGLVPQGEAPRFENYVKTRVQKAIRRYVQRELGLAA